MDSNTADVIVLIVFAGSAYMLVCALLSRDD